MPPMPIVTVSLFEGIILLAITGVFVVAWWGIRRIVKTNDNEAQVLQKIYESLSLICQRLAKMDVWVEMHTRLDDERHGELKKVGEALGKAIDALRESRRN